MSSTVGAGFAEHVEPHSRAIATEMFVILWA